MKKNQIAIIALTVIVLTLVLTLSGIAFRHHRLYDDSKPNIFEIPGTVRKGEWLNGEAGVYYRFFMVQRIPSNQYELKKMIFGFINTSGIKIESYEDEPNARLHLEFMVPSMKFPVYFEDNKNFFEMDDYVEHYTKTNRIAIVRYSNEYDNGEITVFKLQP
jgi:hypothetical protein